MIHNSISQTEPQIENPRQLPLPPAAKAVFQHMFAACRRIVVQAELGSGFSGSWVFVVHPIRDTPTLPAVIKIAPASLVKKEYQAYEQHIRDKLSGAAEIRSEPVLVSGGDWGGLHYHLVGGGIFEIESLYSFCRRASIDDIRHVLTQRLFRRIRPLWQFSSPAPQFNLRASYDPLLPVNLLFEPTTPPPDTPVRTLKPGVIADHPFQQGDYVRLEGWQITEVDPVQKAVTLNLPTYQSTRLSHRLRLQPVKRISLYQVDTIADTIEGMVTATRHDLLRAQIGRVLGQEMAETEILTLPGDAHITLPNPLARLPDVLNISRHARVGSIHGDLNLENVLVDPEARDVRLIDFTMARQDHIMHDLLRLETGVVTWLLPEVLAEAGLPPTIIYDLYESLHRTATASLIDSFTTPTSLHPALRKTFVMLATIRKVARECLFDPDDWGEYYQGLTLYLLGALKFRNLDTMPQAPLPKRLAFWGAATAQKLLQEPLFRTETPSARSHTPPPPNPFTVTLAIRDPIRFIGREAELRRLRTMLQGGSVALLGEPKIGKSSLLWHLAQSWQADEGQRTKDKVIGPLDCLALESRDDFYEQVAEALDLDGPDWRTIRRVLNAHPALLLLDEMDVGPERGLVHADLARLRAACSANRGLKLVTASRTSLKAVFPDPGRGSPAYNFLQPLTLGLLTQAEAHHLLAHPWAPDVPPFDAVTCDQLLVTAGGHPFKLQRAAFHRYQTLTDPAHDWEAAYQEDLEQML